MSFVNQQDYKSGGIILYTAIWKQVSLNSRFIARKSETNFTLKSSKKLMRMRNAVMNKTEEWFKKKTSKLHQFTTKPGINTEGIMTETETKYCNLHLWF